MILLETIDGIWTVKKIVFGISMIILFATLNTGCILDPVGFFDVNFIEYIANYDDELKYLSNRI